MEINCIIVEDDVLAQEKLANFIKRTYSLSLINIFSNSDEALEFLKFNTIDLIFLDIQIPGKDGFELLDSLEVKPKVIVCSGGVENAVRSYEYSVVDFLYKPYSYERFLHSVEKALVNIYQQTTSPEKDYLNIFEKNLKVRIKVSDIVYVQSKGNYCEIFTSDNKYNYRSKLSELEKELPTKNFLRVHRSYMVANDKISTIKNEFIYCGTIEIPIGFTYKKHIKQVSHLLYNNFI